MEQSVGSEVAPRVRNSHGAGTHLREELIAAAGRLLAASGDPDVLSLRAVAREAGVAAPSVYLQFQSKDDLLRAVVAAHFESFQCAIAAGRTAGSNPATKLFQGALAYCRFAAEHPGSYRIIFDMLLPPWPDLEKDDLPGMSAFSMHVEAVAECGEAGAVAIRDPFQTATGIWTALHGIVTLRRHLPSFPWPPLEQQLTSMLAAYTGIAPSDLVADS
jgi:AcrR family transcriptional regulator